MVAKASCRRLDLQPVPLASALARPSAGSNRPASIAMMAMTTSSSMSVNAPSQRIGFFMVGQQFNPKVVDGQRRTRLKNNRVRTVTGGKSPGTGSQNSASLVLPEHLVDPDQRRVHQVFPGADFRR